jgi:hypothetical protein
MTGGDELTTHNPDVRKHSLNLRGSTPRALAQIRQWIIAHLSFLSRAHVEDVVQVADELTANAYEHGDGPHVIHLIHQPHPCRTTVEVEDSNTAALTLGYSRFGPGAHRGRGLTLVDQISQAWGVRQAATSNGAKTVWAHIAGDTPSCPDTPERAPTSAG